MFTIHTQHVSNANGRPQVLAKGHGRQRTVSVDLSKSNDYNDGAAVGALLDVLLDDRQKAMLRHPSGGQRVQVIRDVHMTHNGMTKRGIRWSINV